MHSDLINAVFGTIRGKIDHNINLKPIMTFEEYVEAKRTRGFSEDQVKEFLNVCDPDGIAAYNKLVIEFNSRLEEINGNKTILEEYLTKFSELKNG
ncbi:MAG: hypothetical protein WCK11_01015 [Candidatus Falkowbacteria bacterium]